MHNFVYNYSKVLANRMQYVLHPSISPQHDAFIKGHSIFNNILIGREIMYDLHRAYLGRGLMAFKLDMELAYDWVQWFFFFLILYQIGFLDNWID